MRKDKGKMKHYKPISFRNCRIPFKNNWMLDFSTIQSKARWENYIKKQD
jgi:hypothetical protein